MKKDVYNLVTSYPLQDAYNDDSNRQLISEIAWNRLTEAATPKYTDSGRIDLFAKDDQEMELYRDNKKVVWKELIEEAISPFTKKSDPPKKDNTPRQEPQEPISQRELKEMPPAVRERMERAGKI